MFNDFEDKSSSKTDNIDNFMDKLNDRLQGIESGEKLHNYVTREDFDKAISDIKLSLVKSNENLHKMQSKGSEAYTNKIESQKLEQEKTNKYLQDKINELMQQMKFNMGHIEKMMDKTSQMD